jgi:hypothetical protein
MGSSGARPRSAGISPEEKARRRKALEQAWRVRAYLPKLRAREEALAIELEQTRELIRDELRAFDELAYEAHPRTDSGGQGQAA